VGVVWIYPIHAAQLQAVLKTTTGGCVLQNQLFAFRGGGGSGGCGCGCGGGGGGV
jgi:hypothetical protein